MLRIASFCFVVLLSCGPAPTVKEAYWDNSIDLVAHQQQYDALKATIEQQRTTLSTTEEARTYLNTMLCDSIFPYWYGTTWDFNGVSQTPREGKIACGYFVSTTLLHAGFKVERVKMAQQPASLIIKTLCKKGSVKTIGGNDVDQLMEYLGTQPDGLYILGLDYHVGFIEKYGENIDFIHASYYQPKHVVREKATQSTALTGSNLFVVGNLLHNDVVLNHWLKGNNIATITMN